MDKTSTVAQFIATHIHNCGKLQKAIARDAGFESPNIITMIKQGQTKLPLDKIGPMASAVGADPMQLFRLCFAEYLPETWAAIEGYFDTALSGDERVLIHAMRDHVGLPYVSCLEPAARKHFDAFLGQLKAQPQAVH